MRTSWIRYIGDWLFCALIRLLPAIFMKTFIAVPFASHLLHNLSPKITEVWRPVATVVFNSPSCFLTFLLSNLFKFFHPQLYLIEATNLIFLSSVNVVINSVKNNGNVKVYVFGRSKVKKSIHSVYSAYLIQGSGGRSRYQGRVQLLRLPILSHS